MFVYEINYRLVSKVADLTTHLKMDKMVAESPY